MAIQNRATVPADVLADRFERCSETDIAVSDPGSPPLLRNLLTI